MVSYRSNLQSLSAVQYNGQYGEGLKVSRFAAIRLVGDVHEISDVAIGHLHGTTLGSRTKRWGVCRGHGATELLCI